MSGLTPVQAPRCAVIVLVDEGPGAQVAHITPGVVNLLAKDARSANGDIIRRDGCGRHTLNRLMPEYVASVTASKQLWLAFSRAREAKPQRASAGGYHLDQQLPGHLVKVLLPR